MTDQAKALLSLAVPITLFLISMITAPRIFSTTIYPLNKSEQTSTPVLLYQRNGFEVRYTNQDLLLQKVVPNGVGKIYEAVLFEILPTQEDHKADNSSLDWVRRIAAMIAGKSQSEKDDPLEGEFTPDDQNIAFNFLQRIRAASLIRGECLPLPLDNTATFQRVSGIRLFLALAIRQPEESAYTKTLSGSSQKFDSALGESFAKAREQGITRLAIPYLGVSDEVGEPVKPPLAWASILTEVDRLAEEYGIESVTLGTFANTEEARRRRDGDFRSAWGRWWREKLSGHDVPAHEPIRLAALVMMFALVGELRRGKPQSLRRQLKVLIAGSAVAGSIISLFAWLDPLLPGSLSRGLTLAMKGVAGSVLGLYMDYFVKLDE
jgi:hypothetical protein